jgi:hypothetical protein
MGTGLEGNMDGALGRGGHRGLAAKARLEGETKNRQRAGAGEGGRSYSPHMRVSTRAQANGAGRRRGDGVYRRVSVLAAKAIFVHLSSGIVPTPARMKRGNVPVKIGKHNGGHSEKKKGKGHLRG